MVAGWLAKKWEGRVRGLGPLLCYMFCFSSVFLLFGVDEMGYDVRGSNRGGCIFIDLLFQVANSNSFWLYDSVIWKCFIFRRVCKARDNEGSISSWDLGP